MYASVAIKTKTCGLETAISDIRLLTQTVVRNDKMSMNNVCHCTSNILPNTEESATRMGSNYPQLGPETVACVTLEMNFTCNADSLWVVVAFRARNLVIHFS